MQRALTILTNSLSSGICIKPDKNWNQPQIPTADLCIPATSSLQTPKRLLLVAHGESPNPTSSVSRTERSADKGNPETSFSSSEPPSELGGGGTKAPWHLLPAARWHLLSRQTFPQLSPFPSHHGQDARCLMEGCGYRRQKALPHPSSIQPSQEQSPYLGRNNCAGC